MSDPKVPPEYSYKRKRRSVRRMLAGSVLAIAILGLTLSRNTLTAPLPNTVEMVDMTWVEVRSAIAHGYTVAIVPSGGIEQNGPHIILGKHNYIVAASAIRIAQELGHTLVTPVVPFVPEGGYDPPSGNLEFPGTLGVPDAVFAQVLEGIARSLKSAGFKLICFIGDHGGNQASQAVIAKQLNAEWDGQGVTVLHVANYYADEDQIKYLHAKGETSESIGDHAGLIDTSELLAVHPQGVDVSRLASLPFLPESTGHSGDPTHASSKYGAALLNIRISAAVRQIRAVVASREVSK
jgi:creatinine amidohydrolase/Fe(II)-dependent formamide hydrolase-like protein